jgi:hypothetical protein
VSALTIITTCKGRLAHLKDSLPAMLASGAHVVLVDYDCPDSAGDWVEANQPEARLVRVRDRPFFNRCEARNLGAAAADGEWLLFLDADVCPPAGFAALLEPLLTPGAYLLPEPRPAELWGAIVVSKADFDAVGGYDEAFEGWGAEDVDLIERLMIAGVEERAFPGAGLRAIHHAPELRARFAPIPDVRTNGRINSLYRVAKNDLARQRFVLDLDGRRRLYADIKAAFLSPNGAATFQIPFRDTTLDDMIIKATLRYDLAPRT